MMDFGRGDTRQVLLVTLLSLASSDDGIRQDLGDNDIGKEIRRPLYLRWCVKKAASIPFKSDFRV